ncbi:hypothetical protein OROMI_008018 [Orobanche minor]
MYVTIPPIEFAAVSERARVPGHQGGIVGDTYNGRHELILLEHHNHTQRGVCVGSGGIVTCIVMKYRTHNFRGLAEGFFYGGSGAEIRRASRMGIRILRHQIWNKWNVALLHSIDQETDVRCYVYRWSTGTYEYAGLFRVRGHRQVFTKQNFLIISYYQSSPKQRRILNFPADHLLLPIIPQAEQLGEDELEEDREADEEEIEAEGEADEGEELELFQSPHASLRKLSLGSVNQYIMLMPSALDKFLHGLFSLANDPNGEVRKLKSLHKLITYCEAQLPPDYIKEFLPLLIPALLSNMAYDDDESLSEAEEDGSLPDQDQDLKPRFYSSRLSGSENVKDDDDDMVNIWNLRKCSAAALHSVSNVFGDEILPMLMPYVQSKLSTSGDETWKEREAAVLALGTIADGCISGLYPHLSQIVAFLIPLVDDKFPLIRSISCWTLSRFSKFIVEGINHPEGHKQFDEVLTGLLRKILDHNKRVQEAACSAFTTLEEALGTGFSQFIQPVFQRCINIIQTQQLAKKLTRQVRVDASAGIQNDKDFIVCSLDSLSGLTEVLGSGIESLVSDSNLRDLLLQCCMDDASDIRLSAFALLGNLARVCPIHLHPRLSEFLDIAAKQLITPKLKENVFVANNACWAIEELAIKMQRDGMSYSEPS